MSDVRNIGALGREENLRRLTDAGYVRAGRINVDDQIVQAMISDMHAAGIQPVAQIDYDHEDDDALRMFIFVPAWALAIWKVTDGDPRFENQNMRAELLSRCQDDPNFAKAIDTVFRLGGVFRVADMLVEAMERKA